MLLVLLSICIAFILLHKGKNTLDITRKYPFKISEIASQGAIFRFTDEKRALYS